MDSESLPTVAPKKTLTPGAGLPSGPMTVTVTKAVSIPVARSSFGDTENV